MKKKKLSRIPEFKTYEEEANFWDTHEFTEFEDELKDVKVEFAKDLKSVYSDKPLFPIWNKAPKEDRLVIRMARQFKSQLEQEARKKGLSSSTLARMWLMEKLHVQ